MHTRPGTQVVGIAGCDTREDRETEIEVSGTIKKKVLDSGCNGQKAEIEWIHSTRTVEPYRGIPGLSKGA